MFEKNKILLLFTTYAVHWMRLLKKKNREKWIARGEEENGSHKFPSTEFNVEQEHGEGLWMKKLLFVVDTCAHETYAMLCKYSLNYFSSSDNRWMVVYFFLLCTSFLLSWCNICDVFPPFIIVGLFVAWHNFIEMNFIRIYLNFFITWSYNFQLLKFL